MPKSEGKAVEQTKQEAVAAKTEEEPNKSPSLPFEVKPLHQKALLKLLHCHHNNNQTLTYPELSNQIGVGEKTKAWQCVAWKDLKSNALIIPAGNKTLKLSKEGIDLAMTFCSNEEMEEFMTPATNEEHHKKIRSKLMREEKGKKYGVKIFDLLLEHKDTSMTRLEICTQVGCKNPDSHGFFYGFKALQKMGLVCKVEGAKKTSAKTEKESDKGSEEDGPQKKKQRVRGGDTLFELSEKAFLSTPLSQEAANTTAVEG